MGPVIRPGTPGTFDNPGDEEVLFVMIMSNLNTVTAPAPPASASLTRLIRQVTHWRHPYL